MRLGGYLVARGWSRAAKPAPWETIWIAKSPIPAASFRPNPRHQSARPLSNHPRNRLLPSLHRLLLTAIWSQRISLSLFRRIAMPDHQSQTRPLAPGAQQRNAMTVFARPQPDKKRGAPVRRPTRG